MNKNTHPTLLAAREFNRRTLLKAGAAAGAVAASGPALVSNAYAASGEINILMCINQLVESCTYQLAHIHCIGVTLLFNIQS